MQNIQIDLLTVLIAAILNMVIGFFWYSKWLFGGAWAKLNRVNPENGSKMRSGILYAVLVSLVIAYFLAFFESIIGITTVSDGMFIGFCIWLGFVATTQISHVIWAKQPIKLFLIDSGCKLLSFLVMGGIIGA